MAEIQWTQLQGMATMVRKKLEPLPDYPGGMNGTTPELAGNGTMTKADAVRACMAAAPEMPPAVAVVWIKEQFGVQIETTVFSSYRCQMRRNEGGRNSSARGRQQIRGEALAEVLAVFRAVREAVNRCGIAAFFEVLALVERYELQVLREMILFIEEWSDEQRVAATYVTRTAPDAVVPIEVARGHAIH